MIKKQKKRSIFVKLRNNFIAGVVVLIPIGITLYLTLFIIKISSKILKYSNFFLLMMSKIFQVYLFLKNQLFFYFLIVNFKLKF